jgi:hypothetical protein
MDDFDIDIQESKGSGLSSKMFSSSSFGKSNEMGEPKKVKMRRTSSFQKHQNERPPKKKDSSS